VRCIKKECVKILQMKILVIHKHNVLKGFDCLSILCFFLGFTCVKIINHVNLISC
jgi:hypothetical protein